MLLTLASSPKPYIICCTIGTWNQQENKITVKKIEKQRIGRRHLLTIFLKNSPLALRRSRFIRLRRSCFRFRRRSCSRIAHLLLATSFPINTHYKHQLQRTIWVLTTNQIPKLSPHNCNIISTDRFLICHCKQSIDIKTRNTEHN